MNFALLSVLRRRNKVDLRFLSWALPESLSVWTVLNVHTCFPLINIYPSVSRITSHHSWIIFQLSVYAWPRRTLVKPRSVPTGQAGQGDAQRPLRPKDILCNLFKFQRTLFHYIYMPCFMFFTADTSSSLPCSYAWDTRPPVRKMCQVFKFI